LECPRVDLPQERRIQQGEDCFTKAIELDGNFVEAYGNRARAELKLKDGEGAKQDNEKAAALRQEKPKR